MLPKQSEKVEFEGEIGVSDRLALEMRQRQGGGIAVAGIVAVNDVTARDLQKKDSQWTRAKGFDTFCPLGDVSRSARPRKSMSSHASKWRRAPGRIERRDGLLHRNAAFIRITCDDTRARRPCRDWNAIRCGALAPGDVVEIEVVGVSKVSNPVDDASVVPRYSNRLLTLPEYPLAGIPEKKRELIARGVDVIDLGAGDADLAPPPAAVKRHATVQEPALRRGAPLVPSNF